MPPQVNVASPDNITLDDFNTALARYPSLIEEIDASKSGAAKTTLKELDAFRYEDAPAFFSGDKPKREMDIDDVKTLVEWKLRHGKFRPTLMKLVSGNEPSFVAETVREAIQTYRKNKTNPQPALDRLVKLKGIGPATASLLLTVHDPDRVIFFSDEAYYWLCGGGQKVPMKYNVKEYAALREAAGALQKRLGVSATDVEKVAYVLLKSSDVVPNATSNATPRSQAKQPIKRDAPPLAVEQTAHLHKPKKAEPGRMQAAKPSKRKAEISGQGEAEARSLRRSKRTRGVNG